MFIINVLSSDSMPYGTIGWAQWSITTGRTWAVPSGTISRALWSMTLPSRTIWRAVSIVGTCYVAAATPSGCCSVCLAKLVFLP